MNAVINKTNRARLYGIHKELFDMANSYADNEHGHIACRLHGISNSVYNIRDIMEVLYPLEGTPPEPQPSEPEKVKPCHPKCKTCAKLRTPKPLAQYLDEYIEHEVELNNICAATALLYAYNSWRELLEQALDTYESTEQVKVRIEKV